MKSYLLAGSYAYDNPLTTAWLVKNAITLKREYFFDPGQVLPVFILPAVRPRPSGREYQAVKLKA